MAAIPYDTARAFANKEKHRNGNFHTDGRGIFTYSVRLAHWENGQVVWDVDPETWRYSATSSRHLSALKYVLGMNPQILVSYN